MATPSGLGTIPFTLITLVFVFIPGLIALDLYYRFSETNPSLSRTQRLVYGSIVSITSLFVLFVIWPLFLGYAISNLSNLAEGAGFPTVQEISGFELFEVVSVYGVHIIITIIIGILVGMMVERRSPGPRDRREPWRYAFETVPQPGELIEVVTSDGTIIHGDFVEAAWDENRRELFLDNPSEINYKDDGVTIEKEVPLGRNILLLRQSIEYVVFPETDPQSGLIDEFDEDKLDVLKEQLDDIGYIEEASGQSSVEDFEEDDTD